MKLSDFIERVVNDVCAACDAVGTERPLQIALEVALSDEGAVASFS